ncbi:hypothetical protein MBLNU457_3416t1 [Dothideomycetes sp. NU457]
MVASLLAALHVLTGVGLKIDLAFPATAHRNDNLPEHFDWAKASSLSDLDFNPCYDTFQCSRLQVPLDYWNGTTNATVSLAIVKYPAAVPITDPRYAGPVLVNPGGPGGSGVDFVLGNGPRLQTILNESNFHDILSFDPRGVGLTEPAVSCSGGIAASTSWRIRAMEEGTLNSSNAALGRLWSMSHALGQACSEVGEDSIHRYLSTASVARDMLEIVEAHGRWRERKAQELLTTADLDNRQYQHLKHRPGTEKIQYWGFSYGTYLGTTFASMFPDRIHRFMLDGVVDAEDYTAGLWYDNLVDTEKSVDTFYSNCARVGYPTCPLAGPKATAADVKKRVQDLVLHRHFNPLAVSGPGYSQIISYSDIRTLIFAALYSPMATYPFMSKLLAGVEKGDGSAFAQVLKLFYSFSCSNNEQTDSLPFPTPIWNKTLSTTDPFASAAIACGDGEPQQYLNKTSFWSHVEATTALSPTLGDIWPMIRMQCAGYPLRPVYRYTGPWTGNTSFPILWLSNTMDPVTPRASALKMAKGFPGSVVLTQDAPGHCSLSGYSRCTREYIRTYMNEGVMPPEETVCDVDVLPFGPAAGDVVAQDVRIEAEMHAAVSTGLMMAGGGLMMGQAMGRINLNILFQQ